MRADQLVHVSSVGGNVAMIVQDSSTKHRVNVLLPPEATERVLSEIAATSPQLLHEALERRLIGRIVDAVRDEMPPPVQEDVPAAEQPALCLARAQDGRECMLTTHPAAVPHTWELENARRQ